MKKVIFGLVLFGFVCGCAKPDSDYSKLEEKTGVEQKKQSEIEQGVIRTKANELELDLQKRYRFYSALAYTYEGRFKIGSSDFAAKVRFFPTIALYHSERGRTIEEVTNDINNLALNSQMVIWNVQAEASATGCAFEAVKPDLKAGSFNLFNKECPTVLNVSLGDGSALARSFDEMGPTSQGLAGKVLNGEITIVEQLVVRMQPTNGVQFQDFILKRKQ